MGKLSGLVGASDCLVLLAATHSARSVWTTPAWHSSINTLIRAWTLVDVSFIPVQVDHRLLMMNVKLMTVCHWLQLKTVAST